MTTSSSQSYLIENFGTSLKFSVPFRKLWINIFGLGFGILVMFRIFFFPFFNIFTPEKINSTPMPPFPIVLFLIPFLVLSFTELFWLAIGVETLEVSNNHIIIRHQIFWLGLSRKLLSDKIDGVFVSRQKIDELTYILVHQGVKFWDFEKGKIAINYGKTLFGGIKTIRFGANLNEVEAKQIANLIYEKFPQYTYKPTPKTG